MWGSTLWWKISSIFHFFSEIFWNWNSKYIQISRKRSTWIMKQFKRDGGVMKHICWICRIVGYLGKPLIIRLKQNPNFGAHVSNSENIFWQIYWQSQSFVRGYLRHFKDKTTTYRILILFSLLGQIQHCSNKHNNLIYDICPELIINWNWTCKLGCCLPRK